MRKTTVAQLQNARVEKDVENAYREEIRYHKPAAEITSPHGTDGYAQWDTVRLLLETKYDLDLKSRVPVCNVLAQMLFYLHKFQNAGDVLPNVLLVGDRDECFILSTAAVQGFLELPIDWSTAPSSGSPELTRALVDGMNLLPYVHDVDNDLDFRELLNQCEMLAAGEVRKVRATEANLAAIFTYWVDRVFTDKTLSATEQVDVFLRCLFQPRAVYVHPTQRGSLVVPGYANGVLINVDQYKSFFRHFRQGYKPSLVEKFYGMKDRLVEDDARRRQGAFFTPKIWTDASHKEVEKVLGANWRDECIVWDPAAGVGNLTRDYDWGELICSTAEKADVDVIREQGWHAEHEVFQYDFLNPGVESPFFEEGELSVLPDAVDRKLKEAAKAGKRLVWFMNPPYAEHGTHTGANRKGVSKTIINKSMKTKKLGLASRQLYAQFMFRCTEIAEKYGFENHTVAIFSKPTFMSSGSFRKFRNWWYDRHGFESGFLFQASQFADVSGRWGISFTVWNSGDRQASNRDLLMPLAEVKDFEVNHGKIKTVYNSDGREASKWVREPIKKLKSVDAPQMSSGLKVMVNGSPRYESKIIQNTLLYFQNKSNALYESSTGVYFLPSASNREGGLSVLPSNYRRAIALYGARKLVAGNWINDKDEYLAPNEADPNYDQWVDDCHVYALLHNGNNCTAMRDVTYKDRTWNISNHFFWLTHEEALEALDTPDTHELYRDCKQHPSKCVVGAYDSNDPYFSRVLPDLNLSPEATAVMDQLRNLWTLSLPHRESYAASKPELHLGCWDCSSYQLKHIFRDLFPEEWKELQTRFKALAERLRPGVYEFGFLKK